MMFIEDFINKKLIKWIGEIEEANREDYRMPEKIEHFETITDPKFAKETLSYPWLLEDKDANRFNQIAREHIRFIAKASESDNHGTAPLPFNENDTPGQKYKKTKDRYGSCRAWNVMFYEWKKTKQVYDVDVDFFMTLVETQNLRLYPKLFRYLPFNTFAITVHDDLILFCNIRIVDHYLILNMCACAIYPDEDAQKKYADEHTMEQTYWFKFDSEETALNIDYNELIKYGKTYTYCVSVIQLCTYLISQKPDIKQAKPQKIYIKTSRKNTRKGTPQTIRTDTKEIGFQIGHQIRLRKKANTETVEQGDEENQLQIRESKGGTKRPHIRCAHWHHYWTGKRDGSEERKLIVKWLLPTYCNGTPKDAVIHAVKP